MTSEQRLRLPAGRDRAQQGFRVWAMTSANIWREPTVAKTFNGLKVLISISRADADSQTVR